MIDWEFEQEQENQEMIASIIEAHNVERSKYSEVKELLLRLFDLNKEETEYILSKTCDFWLEKNGYYKHPLKVKRNKYQKLKNRNNEKLFENHRTIGLF